MSVSTMAFAGSVTFTGSYNSDSSMNAMGSTTALPAGFQGGDIGGSAADFGLTASGNGATNGPVTTSAMGNVTGLTTTAAGAWTYGSGQVKNAVPYNCILGSLATGTTTNALGANPTGVEGMVAELQMTNGTGSTVNSLNFSYREWCLSYGTGQFHQGSDGWDGNTSDANGGYTGAFSHYNDLTGFAFFYKVGSGAWTAVPALNTGTYLAVGANQTAAATLDLSATPWTAGSTITFGWDDDNAYYTSPDQMYGLSDVNVSTVATTPEPCTLVLLGLGGLALLRRRRA
jgi:hypothetical protein